jgi:glycosyltransferase involved in cell wall biosynthesis
VNIALFHNLPSGGALRVLYDQISAFKKRGWKVSLYSFSTADNDFLAVASRADEFFTEPLLFKGLFRFRNYREATRKIAEKINSSSADLVFVSKCRFFGSPPVLRFLRKPLIFYSHEPLRILEYESLAHSPANGSSAGRLWPAFRRMSVAVKARKILGWRERVLRKKEDRKSILAAPIVMTNSHFTADWLHRVYDVKPVVNYQGVDTEFFCPGAAEKRSRVLSVGRMDETKGHDFVCRVLARLPADRRPEWVLVYDSVDPVFEKLFRKEACRLGVSCDLRPRIGDDVLRELYRSSQIVLCASKNEPFGLVALEAMACGTPVFAVKEGGFVETISDGRTGYLLERDETLWADRLGAVLADPRQLKIMGALGREDILKNWNWDLFIGRLEKERRVPAS